MPRVPPLTSAPPSLSPSAAFCAKSGGGSCAAPLAAAVRQGLFDGEEEEVPLCVFYDLDLFDAHLATLKEAFGSTVQHRMAIKACPLSRLMRYAYERWGFGVECASMGEVKLALEHCQIPASMLVFDSPAKTRKELQFALDQKIHTNLDNFVEYQRAKELLAAKATTAKTQTATGLGPEMGVVGLRINPLVGAGQIEALSVSTPESKFGVPVTELEKIRAAFRESPWLTCLHIHIGSGGMGLVVLTQGIRVLVDTAKDLNGSLGRRQISVLDIGGGLPANYASDRMDEGPVPNFSQYAKHLKEQIPELFSGEFQVITEFGQALFAKMGFLASRIEWLKGSEEKPIVVSHFGADLCLRQAYTTQHPRRLEAYKADGSAFETEGEPESKRRKRCLVAGPLCFQGDVVSKDALLPAELKEGDLLVMKDAGTPNATSESVEFVEIKPRETMQQLYDFWGPLA
ncbi:Diaminopimelate decarboxylase (DAP decarboxylase) (DAPDC) [Durusdinium trenchii]|uniref:Diaminopimelate decarboxylase (DAP decarboxylase) (DAPDC) n=1 Tax=Durusdinium trenchii TaxID=1381693 RepID=A0ABP0KV03_9DINO